MITGFVVIAVCMFIAGFTSGMLARDWQRDREALQVSRNALKREFAQNYLEAAVAPCWEVVPDEDGAMYHVRWSKPYTQGEYFMCAHYPEKWRAQNQANEWNRINRSPYDLALYVQTEHRGS